MTIFGGYDLGSGKFYYNTSKKADGASFSQFCRHLYDLFDGQQLFLVVDNASYHKSGKVKKFLGKLGISLHFLPTYSPEYNPVEQVWRWLKPRLYGARAIHGGIRELIGRLRSYVWRWREGRLENPIRAGIGIWHNLSGIIFDC